jgi:hypothetical protein
LIEWRRRDRGHFHVRFSVYAAHLRA